MLYLLTLCAMAATPKDARAFVERLFSLQKEFDPAVFELYADDATLRGEREGETFQMTGAQFASFGAEGLAAAKETNDYSTYSKVKIKPDGDGFRVTARRYSEYKCYRDDAFSLQLEERDGKLLVVDQFMSSVALSRCEPSKQLSVQLEAIIASLDGRLPMALDDETRLDRVNVLGGALIYEMTLVNLESTELDLTQLRFQLARTAAGGACPVGSPLYSLSQAGATLRYVYTTKDGTVMPPIDITPGVCAQVTR
ncbi:MAG: hypothetical protein AAF602_14530 [Myxococcota bacterium]